MGFWNKNTIKKQHVEHGATAIKQQNKARNSYTGYNISIYIYMYYFYSPIKYATNTYYNIYRF